MIAYCEARGLGWRIEWHPVLEKLVRDWLLPALDQEVVIEHISTNHNPVRARTVDGTDAEQFWTSGGGPLLTPEYVEIPLAEVARAIAAVRGG